MEDQTIKKHNFEEDKKKIKKLSEKAPQEHSLKKFQTEGKWLSWNDHRVTGDEINK